MTKSMCKNNLVRYHIELEETTSLAIYKGKAVCINHPRPCMARSHEHALGCLVLEGEPLCHLKVSYVEATKTYHELTYFGEDHFLIEKLKLD